MGKPEDDRRDDAIERAVDEFMRNAEPLAAPKLRNFVVYGFGNNAPGYGVDTYVDAHSVTTQDGTLLFVNLVVAGNQSAAQIKRGFAPGTWAGFEEIVLPASSETRN